MIAVVGCRMLRSAVAADQAVVAVLAAIRLAVRVGAGNVVMKATVGSVITIRVIGAIGAVVGVRAWVIPRVVVSGPIDYRSIDIGAVVVGDATAASPPDAPVDVPGMPA